MNISLNLKQQLMFCLETGDLLMLKIRLNMAFSQNFREIENNTFFIKEKA